MNRTMMYLAGAQQHDDKARRDAIRKAAKGGEELALPRPTPAEKQASRDSFKKEIKRAVDARAFSGGSYRRDR